MGRLSNVFEEKLVSPRDLAVNRAQSISDLGSGSSDLGQAAISASTNTMRTVYRVEYSKSLSLVVSGSRQGTYVQPGTQLFDGEVTSSAQNVVQYGNFVFFNSALDYFNISGEKILNDYPSSGTQTQVLSFLSGCDDYQKWLVENSWPATLGFNSASRGYVQDPERKLVAGTSSFTVEMMTSNFSLSGTIVERMSGSVPAYSIWTSSSAGLTTLYFYVSGATGDVTCSYALNSSEQSTPIVRYLAFVCDRDQSKLSIIHAPDAATISASLYVSGFTSVYPTGTVAVATATIGAIGSISAPVNSYFTVCSGSHGLPIFALTNLSYWSKARSVDDIKNSYAGSIYAQSNLVALYRYAEVIPETLGTYYVRNSASGTLEQHVINVPIVAVYSGSKSTTIVNGSASLRISQHPKPMTSFGQVGSLSRVIENYVSGNQASAAAYDKNNTNIITRLVPSSYLQLEQEMGTEVLQDFLYIIARQFDQIKVAIDQFVNWNKTNYTGFNDTPDTLLKDAANYYGWDFVGSFLNHDAIKYFFGRNIVPGSDLEMKLYQIKNEFWRRTITELSHIYKTKGTRESVEALIRVYGMDEKLVKLKEYGVKPFGQIMTKRINSHRSLPAYQVRDGVFEGITSANMSGTNGFTLSIHARFPRATGTITGTIATVGLGELKYWTTSGSSSGTIQFSSGTEVFAVGSSSFIDGRWWNIFVTAPPTASGGWPSSIYMQKLDVDTVVSATAFTGSSRSFLSGTTFNARVGHVSSSGGSFQVNEVKLYNGYNFTQAERDAQTLDFQNYGVTNLNDFTSSLAMHWRLDDGFAVPGGVSQSLFSVFDFSGRSISGTLSGSVTSSIYYPFQRFLFDYNFIAPIEYGWNEDKIRIYSGSSIDINDHFNEANALALEFNLVDALNEDISKMLATVNNWNNIIGLPVNKYRESYHDLNQYRAYYFKKLTGRINFRKFADVLEFFDKSFVKMIQRLLPARAIFYGEEFVVESHMLERPKVQWAYRRYNPDFVPEGRITMVDHSGSDNLAVSTTLNYR